MIDEELVKLWAADYDKLKEELKNAPGKYDITIPKVIEASAKKSRIMSQVFKELANERKEDGNLVPVIMGYIMARNITEALMGSMLACAVTNQPPEEISRVFSSIIYKEMASPYATLQWECYQKDLIDEFLAEEQKP